MNNQISQITPDLGLLSQLSDMGFPQAQASRALVLTFNNGVESAVQWLMDHQNDLDFDNPMPPVPAYSIPVPSNPISPSDYAPTSSVSQGQAVMGVPSHSARLVIQPGGEHVPAMQELMRDCKVVLVVPDDVQMSPGKLAAQAAHAAVGLYKVMVLNRVAWLPIWEATGERTIVLSVPTSQALQDLAAQALELLLPSYIVRDAGRTEVDPGTCTVLAIGGATNVVDIVTGGLSTLRTPNPISITDVIPNPVTLNSESQTH
mmetsp:Transcript_36868/g.51205  ORF Transcript_36868/g.51205 Transcript_36868/m.51205 type:complete len:260 (-) Transcript_36868:8-787(-)